MMTIQIGDEYAELCLVGWTVGDGTGHAGYSAVDYFDADGRYLGPDRHGIEPIFEGISAADLAKAGVTDDR